jgi:UrcA family protein
MNVANNLSTRIHEGIHMGTNRVFVSAFPVLGIAVAACMLCAGGVSARDLTVAFQVSTKGLDLRQPAGAHELYSRLQHAAEVVCTHGMRVDLQPSPDPEGCYEKALGDAIRSVNLPLLTQVYLETHTLRQAAARGINLPVIVAAQPDTSR